MEVFQTKSSVWAVDSGLNTRVTITTRVIVLGGYAGVVVTTL